MSKEPSQDDEQELTEPGGKVRLYVGAALSKGAFVAPGEGQAHYLLHVMRAKEGDAVSLFNGRDGEWRARVSEVARKSCMLQCEAQVRPQAEGPDMTLAFAPIKKTPSDYLAQKATELGVRVLQPVITHRTIARRVNSERMLANAVEAAEQSDRLTVPEVKAPVGLAAFLKSWPREKPLIFCDESGEARTIAIELSGIAKGGGWGLLIGPEGGFDSEERQLIRARTCVLPVTLGPRILRADTAALAALAIWQSMIGDW